MSKALNGSGRAILSAALVAEVRPRLVSCVRWELPDTWRIDNRVIPRPILWCVTRGSVESTVDGTPYSIGPGEVLLLYPGARLSARPGAQGPPALISVNFHAQVLGQQELTVLADLPPRPHLAAPARVLDWAERLAAVEEERPLHGPLLVLAGLAEILAMLLEAHQPTGDELPPHPYLLAALRHIHAHLGTTLRVGRGAGDRREPIAPARCSPPPSGCRPCKMRQAARFVAACNLLSDSSLGVAEVADRLGFDDPNYFGRWFRRQAGVSPSRYRRRFVL